MPGKTFVAQKTADQKVVPPENVRRVRRTQPRKYLLQTQLDTNVRLNKGTEALFYMLGKIKIFYRKNIQFIIYCGKNRTLEDLTINAESRNSSQRQLLTHVFMVLASFPALLQHST